MAAVMSVAARPAVVAAAIAVVPKIPGPLDDLADRCRLAGLVTVVAAVAVAGVVGGCVVAARLLLVNLDDLQALGLKDLGDPRLAGGPRLMPLRSGTITSARGGGFISRGHGRSPSCGGEAIFA
jgi:hypothetical protein